MLLVLLLAIIKIMYTGISEAHVFCQDLNATPWTPLGYSCPVNCPSVIEAVKRLQKLDHRALIAAQESNTTEQSHTAIYDTSLLQDESNEIDDRNLRTKENEPKQLELAHYYGFAKILRNKRAVAEFKTICKSASNDLKNELCLFFRKVLRDKRFKSMAQKLVYKECSRQSAIEKEFLKKFTDVLNKHTTTDCIFTEDMTGTLLEKVLGTSMDLRQGVFDVVKLLKYLRQAANDLKRSAKRSGSVITLQSKFCLNVYVPGCFCIPGFVESDGQCVLPADCLSDMKNLSQYLSRITVK